MTSIVLAVIGVIGLILSFLVLRNLERFTDEAKKMPGAPIRAYSQGGFGCGAIAVGLMGVGFLIAALVLIGR